LGVVQADLTVIIMFVVIRKITVITITVAMMDIGIITNKNNRKYDDTNPEKKEKFIFI
jgi:hypothetical protein